MEWQWVLATVLSLQKNCDDDRKKSLIHRKYLAFRFIKYSEILRTDRPEMIGLERIQTSHLTGLLSLPRRPGLALCGRFALILCIDAVAPSIPEDGSSPNTKPSGNQKHGADGTKPPNANRFHGRKNKSRAQSGKNIPEHVIPGNNLGTAAFGLHHVETVGIQARETEQLCHALQEHGQHGHRDAANGLVNSPPVDKNTSRDNDAQKDQTRLQSILRDTSPALADPFLDRMICPPSTHERTQKVSTPGSDIEESRLNRASEIEARVQHISDGREQGVLVPDQSTGRNAREEEIRVCEEEYADADRADAVAEELCFLREAHFG